MFKGSEIWYKEKKTGKWIAGIFHGFCLLSKTSTMFSTECIVECKQTCVMNVVPIKQICNMHHGADPNEWLED